VFEVGQPAFAFGFAVVGIESAFAYDIEVAFVGIAFDIAYVQDISFRK